MQVLNIKRLFPKKVWTLPSPPPLFPPEHRLVEAVCMGMGNLYKRLISHLRIKEIPCFGYFAYNAIVLFKTHVIKQKESLNDRQSTSGENYKYELDWWAFLSIWHLPPVSLWETNGNLEWKPNTNKVNRVNSNRQKKSSGRHLMSRSAPCRGFQDDRKKQQVKATSGKNWRKNLKGKLCGVTTIARIFYKYLNLDRSCIKPGHLKEFSF